MHTFLRTLLFTLPVLCMTDAVKAQKEERVPPPYKQEMPVRDSVMRLDNGTKTDTSSDLRRLIDAPDSTKREYVTATFKSTRVINGQSVENQAKGVLDFIILHRFGSTDQGARNFFGLDNANTRIGFEYGVTNWLTAGIGRSTYQKEFDGFVRIRILRQTKDNHMPVTLSYAGTAMARSDEIQAPDTITKYFFSNRMSYCNQLLIARKFSERLSLQLTPSHVHYNLVRDSKDANDLFAIGIGGRVKLTHRFALTAEYFYRIPGTGFDGYHNAASIGVDIETGGHVFQLQFTNATGMSERTFLGQTTDSWNDGSIHFGFNLHRVFTIVKPKELS
jgi:hypothetical protein